MKFIVILFLILPVFSYSQLPDSKTGEFANKQRYLVDSLSLQNLTSADRLMLDSCLELYHTARHDTNRIYALAGICENMVHVDWIKYQRIQLRIIQRLLGSEAEEIPDFSVLEKDRIMLLKLLSSALNNIGYYTQHYQGDLSTALSYYRKCFIIDEELRNEEGIAMCLNNIGYIYEHEGAVSKALDYYHRSLKIREKIKDYDGTATSLNNIGAIYKNLDDATNALVYFQKSLEIRQRIRDKLGIAQGLNNIGSIYFEQGDPNCKSSIAKECLESGTLKALKYLQECLDLQLEMGDKKGISLSFNNIGLIYSKRGDPSCREINDETCHKAGLVKALDNYNKSLLIREEIGDEVGIIISLYNIGVLYADQGKANQAKEFAERSMNLATQINFVKGVSNAAQLLARLAAQEGNHKKAFQMHQLHVKMRDSLNNEETQKAAMRQQAKYEFEKKERLIKKETEQQIAMAEKEKAQQKLIAMFSGGFALALLLFLLVLNGRYRVTRKQKSVIEQQHDDLIQSSQKILLIEKQKHELELAQKQRDLEMVNANNLLKLTVKKNLHSDLRHLVQLKNPLVELKSLLAEMHQQTLAEEKIQTVHNNMNAVDSKFLEVLHLKFPELTKTEREICAYIKLNLTIKDIASLRKSSANSIGVIRSRVRAKLNVPQKENLEAFIQNI